MYKNQAYGTTYEPAVFIYNKRLVTADEVPQDHAAFAKLLDHEDRQVQGQGHDVRHREERRRLHVRRAGREILPRHEGPRERLRRDELPRLLEHRQHAGEGVVGRAPARLQRAGLVCAGAREEGPEPRRRAAEGLHAGAVARDVHRQAGEEPERGQGVDRLHPVRARPEADRQRRRAVRDPHRRRRRIHGGVAQQAARRQRRSRSRSARRSSRTSTRRSASNSWPPGRQTLARRRQVSRTFRGARARARAAERRGTMATAREAHATGRAPRASRRGSRPAARADDPRHGVRGARAAVADRLPEPARRAVLRRGQDRRARRLRVHLRRSGFLERARQFAADRRRHDADRRAARRGARVRDGAHRFSRQALDRAGDARAELRVADGAVVRLRRRRRARSASIRCGRPSSSAWRRGAFTRSRRWR